MTQPDIRPSSKVSMVAAQTHPAVTAFQASATGKAIIVGEHAVVYGAKAVAMPVHSLQMALSLTPTDRTERGGKHSVRMLIGGRAATEHLRGVVDDAFAVMGIAPFSLDIEGHSTVMIGAGLGSSASLCVVILKAIAAASGRILAAAELANFANQLERRFHGNPSGLDTAAVAMERVIGFRKGETPQPLSIAMPAGAKSWRFALIDSGVRSSTLSMIQVAAPYFQGPDGQVRVSAFDELAEQVSLGLAHGDQAQVAVAMNEASVRLGEAGVVSKVLHDLIGAARAGGCIAAKPTGAGGGGCVLALLAHDQADGQLAALREQLGGTKVYSVELQ